MHDHRQILELAAAAIDFELDPAERSRLHDALEECTLCRRQVAAMRATATILGRPSDIGTPSRVRDVVVGAALRGGRTPGWRPLLVASLSLLVVLGGTAIVVGNRGSAVLPPVSPSASGPVQTAVAQVSPSPTATPTPNETQPSVPAETSTPSVTQAPDDNGPLRVGDIAAMATDGRLVIRTQPGRGTDSAVYKTNIYPGQRMLILEGPVEASGYPWFRVRLGAIEGWVAAASQNGDRWLAPVRNGLIAFVRDAADGSGEAIYTITPDVTGGETLLLADPGLVHYAQLTWSPDGRRLAFVGTLADAVNGSSEIFVVDADGSNLVQITQNDVDDDSPAWSPDGTRLALRVDQVDPSAPVDSTVVVTPVDGPGVTVLGPGANPVWSPDGLQIAMTVAEGGSSRIWVQAPDGGGRRQVADVSVASARPAWSPEGQSLVFSSSGLFLVDVASGSITPLAVDPGALPTWSPGGTIAFSTTGSASPGVVVVDSDGRNLRRLSGDPGFASAPVWSPDGRRLLLGDDVRGSSIAIVDPDSATMTPILDDGTNRSPAWQPRLP